MSGYRPIVGKGERGDRRTWHCQAADRAERDSSDQDGVRGGRCAGSLLARLSRDGYLGEPWLGDEISREVRDFYNRNVMESPNGPYAALVAYHAELVNVRDSLWRTEQEYRRVEGENSALWGRL